MSRTRGSEEARQENQITAREKPCRVANEGGSKTAMFVAAAEQRWGSPDSGTYTCDELLSLMCEIGLTRRLTKPSEPNNEP